MLPRLVAEESLIESQRITVGTGAGKAQEMRATTSRWAQLAGGRRERAAKATPQALGAIGIGVRPARRDA